MQDVVKTWDAWAMLLATSLQFGSPQRQLPTLLFVVDGDAEFVGPMDTPTSVFLPPGVTTVMTDLYQIGGNTAGGGPPWDLAASTPASMSGPSSRRRGIGWRSPSLISGEARASEAVRASAPGLYVGAVYAMEVATRRPLAVVYVLDQGGHGAVAPKQDRPSRDRGHIRLGIEMDNIVNLEEGSSAPAREPPLIRGFRGG